MMSLKVLFTHLPPHLPPHPTSIPYLQTQGKIQGAHFILKLLTTSKFDYIRQGYLKEEATQVLSISFYFVLFLTLSDTV
jgi:hypothetical protein